MVLITVVTGANLSQRSHIVAGGPHIGLEPTGFRELIINFSQRNKIWLPCYGKSNMFVFENPTGNLPVDFRYS